MKNINILPSKYRYDYRKHYLVKVLTYFFILNIILLGVIFAGQTMYLSNIKKQIKTENDYLTKVRDLNGKFGLYKKQLTSYKGKLTELKEKEKAFHKYFKQTHSPYISILVLFNSLQKNLFIEEINYTDGEMEIKGNAKNERDFYEYYKKLEKNPYLSYVGFRELDNTNEKKGSETYSYEIKLTVKKLDDIY